MILLINYPVYMTVRFARSALNKFSFHFRGDSRYNYTHAILKNEDSYFNAQLIAKGRRISVICRNDVK